LVESHKLEAGTRKFRLLGLYELRQGSIARP